MSVEAAARHPTFQLVGAQKAGSTALCHCKTPGNPPRSCGSSPLELPALLALRGRTPFPGRRCPGHRDGSRCLRLGTQPGLTAINPQLARLKPFVPDHMRARFYRVLLKRPTLAPEVAADLRQSFAEDIRQLKDICESDIDHWLAGRSAA